VRIDHGSMYGVNIQRTNWCHENYCCLVEDRRTPFQTRHSWSCPRCGHQILSDYPQQSRQKAREILFTSENETNVKFLVKIDQPRSISDEQVVGIEAVHILSFTAISTSCKGSRVMS